MESIDELIFSEFSHAGYSVIGKIKYLPVLANEDKTDFWMVSDDFDIDEDKQKGLYDEYGHLTEKYLAAEKNISVLILKKVPHIDEKNRQWAVEMENDKYFFKKYVLLYTEEAFTMLQKEVLVNDGKHLSDYLCDRLIFEKLKADGLEGFYTLLYGIAHKLPFLLVLMEKSQLELAYPEAWSSSTVFETNHWVNDVPIDEEDMDKYLNGILKSIDNE